MNPAIECRFASLLAFAQSRNCGIGPGGFQSGNTCASGKAADAAKGAVAGAIKGAAVALGVTGPVPQFIAQGAAAGAAVGAVKGLYDNHMQPTRVMRQIRKIGSTEKQVSDLVKHLGGSPASMAKVAGGKLTLAIKDKSGKKIFDVAMNQKNFVVTPARKSGTLTKSEMAEVKKIADENSPKEVSVIVKSRSPSYLATLVKKGFRVTANAAGDVVATVVIPFIPGVVGTVVAVTAENLQKKKP
jgi:hypothetical protein